MKLKDIQLFNHWGGPGLYIKNYHCPAKNCATDETIAGSGF
ncbi:MAG: hypothetical protein ABI707_13485 [Ferruginibacter sp.]